MQTYLVSPVPLTLHLASGIPTKGLMGEIPANRHPGEISQAQGVDRQLDGDSIWSDE